MGEETIPFFADEIKDTMQGIIKVVGIGGGLEGQAPSNKKRFWYSKEKPNLISKKDWEKFDYSEKCRIFAGGNQ